MNKEKESKQSKIINYIGLGLVAIAYIGAVLNMLKVKREEEWSGKKVIRICHWQLEGGFREGINYVIDEFEKLHPDCKVVQLPMYDRAYAQFINTQLIGGTAPDIIELGFFAVEKSLGRYFYPLSEYVFEVNEFNADNEYAQTPWINTFKDGLRGNWDELNMDYFSVSLNFHTIRMYYNRNMVQKITGTDTLPTTYRGLLNVCRKIREYGRETGEDIFPIAASNYQISQLRDHYYQSLTTNYLVDIFENDFSYKQDGMDIYISYLKNLWDMNDPELKAGEEASKAFAPFYQKGFMAMQRQESLMSFIQQKSLIFSSGSWDVSSLIMQAKEAGFEIGILDLPNISPEDPEYGQYFDGVPSEASGGISCNFGLCRFSKYPDIAMKFLRFATSKKINAEMNKIIRWVPSIRNAEMLDVLKPFDPRMEGIPKGWRSKLALGTKTDLTESQSYWEYISDKTSYEDYIGTVRKRFIDDGIDDLSQHTIGYFQDLVPLDFSRSYFGLQLALQDLDTVKAEEYSQKLSYVTESYGVKYITAVDNVLRVLDVARLDNDRVKEMKNSYGYKTFIKEFVQSGQEQ